MMSETENNPSETEQAPAEEAAPASVDEGNIIAGLQAEIEKLQDKMYRAVAEADNTRKRAEKEVRDTREYAVSGFAKDMLDVADNLQRALAAVDETTLDTASEAMKNLVEGVAMTERALISKMERHGVTKVDPDAGSAFDPHVHQAVAQIPSEHAAGTIAAVMQTGFVIGGRTLRAAMVAVSAGPATGNPGGDPGSEPGGSVDVKA